MAKKTSDDHGQKEVQERSDVETEQGFRGDGPVDPTPNEAYTVEGVTSGEPTPETDAKAAAKAEEAARGEG